MNSLNSKATETRGYAPVNGLKMYYEIEGTGEGACRGLPCGDTATRGCVIHAQAGVPVPPKPQVRATGLALLHRQDVWHRGA
jgi:hypothetical protein